MISKGCVEGRPGKGGARLSIAAGRVNGSS